MKRWKKWIILLMALLVLSGAAMTMVYLVYHGYIIPNQIFISDEAVIGCDVSCYQGDIEWGKLEEQGIQFAFIKATEGSIYTDDWFAQNWEGVAQTGIMAGAYHFFSFESAGETQAQNYIQTVGKRDGMLVPVVDVEFYGNNNKIRPDAEAVRTELEAYIAAIEAKYQIKPIIYATKESYEYFLEGYFEECPLWIRSIIGMPNMDKDWTFWQYTNREKLEGYYGREK